MNFVWDLHSSSTWLWNHIALRSSKHLYYGKYLFYFLQPKLTGRISIFQTIVWHPNSQDYELCLVKGKSQVRFFWLQYFYSVANFSCFCVLFLASNDQNMYTIQSTMIQSVVVIKDVELWNIYQNNSWQPCIYPLFLTFFSNYEIGARKACYWPWKRDQKSSFWHHYYFGISTF